MGVWILLSVVSGFAIYLAVSLNRPIWIIVATAVATALGLLMIVLRVLLAKKVREETRRR